MTALPSPREILTSLISSLASIPISDQPPTTTSVLSSHRPSNQPISSNPFKLIPPAYRSLLTTLHVLYPSTLLPALDLLDRRLVTRVILAQDGASANIPADKNPTSHPAHEPHADAGVSESKEEREGEDSKPAPLYHLVRSAQPPRSHRRSRSHSTFPSGRVYIVRLESWNCTCAAFAFSAFPPLSSQTSTSLTPTPHASSFTSGTANSRYQILPATHDLGEEEEGEDDDIRVSGGEGEDSARKWEFGGLSLDGKDGAGGVPCCKHLLACLLAERWDAVLGGYVEERLVGREEGAGLVGDL